jgi:hypothetical protein
MIIYLEPIAGGAESNIDRARAEMERVMGFRGSITDIQAKGGQIIVKIKVSPDWDLPLGQKLTYLNEWITVKTRHFKVKSILLEKL